MPLDRDDALKKAEKLLRQGRLDAAIAEYVRIVQEQPRDWTTANALGDVYARAGQADKAIAQYSRIADHFTREGFYPKAAALYKKILKITPDDEIAQRKLAELSVKQGLLADAKSYWNAIAARRRARGDHRGAAEVVVRLGELDPTDFDARFAAARTLVEMGEPKKAASHFRQLHTDLTEKGRTEEATAALRQAVALDPAHKESRTALAESLVNAGDYVAAREFLDPATVGGDPGLLLAVLEMDLRSGELVKAQERLAQLLAKAPDFREKVVRVAWSLVEENVDAAYVCVEALTATADAADAAALLQEFVTHLRGQIPALLKLVDVSLNIGLEPAMHAAQTALVDAYLGAGDGIEARRIAEDLVAREPWEPAHLDRFRRALVLLRVSDPDTLIAERLGGRSPFTARDPFVSADVASGVDSVEPTLASDASTDGDIAVPSGAPAFIRSRPQTATAVEAADANGAHVEIDLTGALADLHTGEVAQAPVPAQPTEGDDRQGVALQVPGDPSRRAALADSAEQMTLARTYLDMGMEEDAISALQAAVRWPSDRFEAASMLARLHRRRGEVGRAIEWLERAWQASPPTPEDEYSTLYELGSLLESQGETARALAVFLELQAIAGEYRDVSARVDHLARVQTGG